LQNNSVSNDEDATGLRLDDEYTTKKRRQKLN
jgi:hypothetical protein